MTYDDIINIWLRVNALSGDKAKAALFGLIMKDLFQQDQNLSQEDVDKVIKLLSEERG